MLRRCSPRALAALAACCAAALTGVPRDAAQSVCAGRSPAFGVTSLLWDDLAPTDVGLVPFLRDSTNYTGLSQPDANTPLFSALDIEDDVVFVTYSTGVQTWSIAGPTFARDPQRLAARDGLDGHFLDWDSGIGSETREWVWDVDLPDGDGGLAAAVGIAPVGMTIWDLADPADPEQLYQDSGRTAYQVYSAVLAGRSYAFAAVEQSVGNGLHRYDLTAARSFPSGCLEDTTLPPQQHHCPGVYKGRIGALQSTSFVDGAGTTDGRHFVVTSSGSPGVGPRGVEIWEVTDPASPVNVKPGGGRYLAAEGYYGVSLWEDGGGLYLAALRLNPTAQYFIAEIYDLTPCLATPCASLAGNLLWSADLHVSSERGYITDSKSGSTPMLYFGNQNMCSGGFHREWLYDVSNPAAPAEVGTGIVVEWPNPGGTPDPYEIDYWSWYYAASPTGFSLVMPRMGKFRGNYFYRAAWTLFDVHEWTPSAPVDLIFEDGFESGGLAAWTASAP
jgi:hypothetical protein